MLLMAVSYTHLDVYKRQGLDFDEESVYYYRFITHLKFFAQRLFLENKQYTDEDNPLYLSLIHI